MTQKELQQQAKEYGYTVEEIKEFRKHIKPFLKYAIEMTLKDFNTYGEIFGMCSSLSDYRHNNILPVEYYEYIKSRMKFARPLDSGNDAFWWGIESTYNYAGVKKRIDFCKTQLKLVKP